MVVPMSGIDQVRARIAEITRTTANRSAAVGTTSSDAGFASMLASAIGADATDPLASGGGSSSISNNSLSSLLSGAASPLASGDLLTTLGSMLTNPAIARSAAGSPWASVTAGASVTSVRPADGAPPAELAVYGNGRIPESALVAIDPTGAERLWAPAARAFDSMRTAAAADGVELAVTDSYRSYDQQVQMAQEKGLYGHGGLAAVPGTSEHGWGRALDLDVDARGQAWLQQHAPSFGFTAPVAGEPWHWEYGSG
jgi:zinc D-Ala-D-Ala carboxypeptidase